MVFDQGVEEGAGVDRGERLVDACGGLLVGEFDDVGWAGIELAMARGLIFVGPGHRGGPDLGGAPGVISHNDDGGGVPLIVLFKQPADVGEVAVGESEVVDVGGVSCAEGLFAAVVEAVGMRDGKVQEEKGDGRGGEVGVARGEELAVVAGVLADVAIFVRVGSRQVPCVTIAADDFGVGFLQ